MNGWATSGTISGETPVLTSARQIPILRRKEALPVMLSPPTSQGFHQLEWFAPAILLPTAAMDKTPSHPALGSHGKFCRRPAVSWFGEDMECISLAQPARLSFKTRVALLSHCFESPSVRPTT